MDVTRSNFSGAFEQFAVHLGRASFVSFDEEMTGIRVGPHTDYAMVDSTEERYTKMRQVASTFRLIQVGICLWEEDSTTRLWLARPFNFYVFPESGPGGVRIMCIFEYACVSFLVLLCGPLTIMS
jgi:poly(A)-specific ribonuclease